MSLFNIISSFVPACFRSRGLALDEHDARSHLSPITETLIYEGDTSTDLSPSEVDDGSDWDSSSTSAKSNKEFRPLIGAIINQGAPQIRHYSVYEPSKEAAFESHPEKMRSEPISNEELVDCFENLLKKAFVVDSKEFRLVSGLFQDSLSTFEDSIAANSTRISPSELADKFYYQAIQSVWNQYTKGFKDFLFEGRIELVTLDLNASLFKSHEHFFNIKKVFKITLKDPALSPALKAFFEAKAQK